MLLSCLLNAETLYRDKYRNNQLSGINCPILTGGIKVNKRLAEVSVSLHTVQRKGLIKSH